MSDQREQSPDWVQNFQVPVPIFALSSDSDISLSNSPVKESLFEEPVAGGVKVEELQIESEEEELQKAKKPRNLKKGKQANDLKEEYENEDYTEGGVAEDDSKKSIYPGVTASLPLVFPDKVQRQKALVECDGDSIDLGGDVGAVGRVVIATNPSGDEEMLLDIKGTIYKSSIVPSTTFCIVSFGQTEAKIESIMSDFVQLRPHSNVFEAETMIEGTLEGFSFDSEDEADKSHKALVQQDDMGVENGEQPKSKVKGRKEKKAKSIGRAGKATKRAAKKPQTSRKGRGSKK